ncbi:hypothetical protein [Halomonas sp. YLGW01]|uniref:hypothetical protein n=1 Tax=Halomonas sp. YLGW01 TaxID=2773308 RepID=UPI00177DF39E|nr:hypothetical protein [Halomonas sp. YLGW01]
MPNYKVFKAISVSDPPDTPAEWWVVDNRAPSQRAARLVVDRFETEKEAEHQAIRLNSE